MRLIYFLSKYYVLVNIYNFVRSSVKLNVGLTQASRSYGLICWAIPSTFNVGCPSQTVFRYGIHQMLAHDHLRHLMSLQKWRCVHVLYSSILGSKPRSTGAFRITEHSKKTRPCSTYESVRLVYLVSTIHAYLCDMPLWRECTVSKPMPTLRLWPTRALSR